jgi:hypothetical protein
MLASALHDGAAPRAWPDARACSTAAVIVVFLAVGAALYGPGLNAFFVADDFELLASVSASPGPLVIVQPLFTRFVRPAMVLAFDLCYRMFDLVPWPYHAVPLLAHVTNACLVYLLGRRFLAARDAFPAGLLFLTFSAHPEAIVWPASMGDPFVTLGVLVSLLAYPGIVEDGASPGLVAAFAGGLIFAALSKELWIVYPGILIAYVLLVGAPPAPSPESRSAVSAAAAAGRLSHRVSEFGRL